MKDFYTMSRKGQSAIEYLTTYGWALLAIVIVGAVLSQMGVFNQCQQTTPQFSGQSAAVGTWSFTGTNQLNLQVEAVNEDITDVGVAIDTNNDGNYDYSNSSAIDSLAAGNSAEIVLDTADEFDSGQCATATLALNYTVSGLSDNTLGTGSGSLRAPVP